MAVIQDRAMTPTPLPPSRKPASKFNWSIVPIWVNFVTAAAVLIVISVGSYLYFSASDRYYREQERIAAEKNAATVAEAGPVAAKTPGEVNAPETSVASKNREAGPEVIGLLPRVFAEAGPSPRDVTGDVHLSPPRDMPEIESFQIDKIRVSHLFNLHDLSTDLTAQDKLVGEIKKDELIRLDLFCNSAVNALDRVLNGLKARGVVVFIDAFAQDQLKKKSPPELMIFTESLTPDEVAGLLVALGADDKASGSAEFDTLVAAPFLPADLTQLSKLLGIPSVTPKAPKGKLAIDIRKPLPEGTANEVAAMLSKMGSKSTSPPKNEKVAVVVAYSPMNANPAASRDQAVPRPPRRTQAKRQAAHVGSQNDQVGELAATLSRTLRCGARLFFRYQRLDNFLFQSRGKQLGTRRRQVVRVVETLVRHPIARIDNRYVELRR